MKTADEIELIDNIITNKISDFMEKYGKYPKYIKLPMWVNETLKKQMRELTTFKMDCNTELFLYRNLRVRGTTTISHLEEIEVF